MARTLVVAALVLSTPIGALSQSCKSTDGAECDRADEASMLQTADTARVSEAVDKASCNEQKFAGLCYRSCTDMGAMEPRHSAMKCGGHYSSEYNTRCVKDGSGTPNGISPGLMGRDFGKCFGSDAVGDAGGKNMCTMSCKGAQYTIRDSAGKGHCCSDHKTKPTVTEKGGDVSCECAWAQPEGTAKPAWWKHSSGTVVTPTSKQCDTGCANAKGYLVKDGVGFCCADGSKPKVSKQWGLAFVMKCSCE